MGRAEAVRLAMLYAPIALAGAAWALRRPAARERAGVVLALAWNVVALAALHAVAQRAGWWSFAAKGGTFLGMPVEAYVGWAVLWGIALPVAFGRVHPIAVILVALWLDVLAMPLCAPVLHLGPHWLVGEAAALAGCLLPALLLARWTARGERLYVRAATQAVLSGALVLWLIPSVVFAQVGGGWSTLLARPLPSLAVWAQILALAAVPGLSATQEFATRGGGTPIPFDPPPRLVRTGPYAYVANPMQLAAAVTLTLWGAALGSGWVMLGGPMAVCYSIGLAAWDEDADLRTRHGSAWTEHRRHFRPWLPRWHRHVPADAPAARLYVSAGCGACSQVARWVLRHRPIALDVVPAQAHPSRDLWRVTYDAGDGGSEEEGVAAIARALEHLNAIWALAGMAMRLPVIAQALQLLVDASGGGPRRVARWTVGGEAAEEMGAACAVAGGGWTDGG